jgi:glyoxylase-like metal-dependent hydrolase (beta-lactamase superfamily II)
MHHQRLNEDTWSFVGDAYESAATAFVDGGEVFLVDALASLEDARWMRQVMAGMGLTVRMIASTHYMSDHMAGLGLFPEATTIAHENHRHAFLSQNARVDGFYVDPTMTFTGAMEVRWGRHHLRLIHNPGKTMDHVTVDAPEADLACAGDNLVGNIVYLSKSDPDQIERALARIQQLGRQWVISGHMGRFPASTLGNARHYLARLREASIAIRRRVHGDAQADLVARIRIEACLPAGVTPRDFEREWHQNNLSVIRDQGTFELDAHRHRSPAIHPHDWTGTGTAIPRFDG